jgi:hypothetical protein
MKGGKRNARKCPIFCPKKISLTGSDKWQPCAITKQQISSLETVATRRQLFNLDFFRSLSQLVQLKLATLVTEGERERESRLLVVGFPQSRSRVENCVRGQLRGAREIQTGHSHK